MKIEFCIRDKEAYNTACSVFADISNISIKFDSITNATYSTIISAGNSFGEMNGGVDGIINTHLSSYTPHKYIQEDVKNIINNEYIGELPVGQSILVHTNHPFHTQLIYAPTMRVAEDVSTTLNAYIAFRNALVLMKNRKINAASTPLFCTGAGNMSLKNSCEQMKEAYKSVMTGNLINKNWIDYHTNQRYLKSYTK